MDIHGETARDYLLVTKAVPRQSADAGSITVEYSPLPQVQQVAYRRIANGLRDQILSGKLAAGDRLPSQGALAATWQSSAFTISAAVQTLVKEGWVHSIRRRGIYVAESKNRFICAGIYHGADVLSNEQASYRRALVTSLMDQFARLEKEVLVFVEARPLHQQGKILPALAEALHQRRVQCLIAPEANRVNVPALSRLKVPTVFSVNLANPHTIGFDRYGLMREAVRQLARRGCRSVGVISHALAPVAKDPWARLYEVFVEAAHTEGLATKEEWIRGPGQRTPPNFERYGYHEFKNLWKLRQKPEGLIVYPDNTVRGVVTAILEVGKKLVTPHMEFVFHRNAHVNFLCPLAATWAIADEALVAKEMIGMIQKQFNGEKISPTLLPHSFKYVKGEE